MNQSAQKARIRLCSIIIALGLLCSCAAREPVITSPPQPVEVVAAEIPAAKPIEPPTDPEPLYLQLAADLAEYQAGIEMIVAGDEVAGEAALVAARNGINSGIAECSSTPGCEPGRFFAALDQLLNTEGIALKKQASRIEELETGFEQALEREPGTSFFVRELPELDRTVSLLHGTDLQEIINLNGPVKAAIHDWLTWMRPLLMSAHENYQFLRADIAPIFKEAGLPEALLFGMLATETGGKVHSYSRAGAVGPLQFIRSTGRRYGLTEQDGFDMRLDPVASAKACVAYLDDQFKALNDSLEKALAAYNGGENRLARLDRRLGGISFWDGRMYYSLPHETREYVPRILAAAWLFMHPEDYKLEFPVHQPETVQLQLQGDISIGELTICLGQRQNPNGWFRTLRNLNPRLEPGERIKAGTSVAFPAQLVPLYESECVAGEYLDRARRLHDANYPEEPELIIYEVRRGDTLGRIAERHSCVSIGELAAINKIRPPRYMIRTGQELKIPVCG